MALLRPLAMRTRCASAWMEPVRPCPTTALWKGASGSKTPGANFGGHRRQFSTLDPYRTLGAERGASDADIKKAYKDKALKWHPDRNPDNMEEAQKKFSEATTAYEILKDPQTRQEYDMTGRVGGQNGAPGGPQQAANQAAAERMFREAFGGQGMGMEQIMAQLLMQQQQQQGQGGFGGFGGPPRPRVLQAGMEVQIKPDTATIDQASRACGIDADNDSRRATCAGKVGTVVDTDPKDQSVKLRVMVQPGRADEVWFGAGAVEFLPQEGHARPGHNPFGHMGGPRPGGCGGGGAPARPAKAHPGGFAPDMEVLVRQDVDTIHEASRACGIDGDNDARRAACAGKLGTIIDTDISDQSLKVRVMVLPGRADEVWFGVGAVEPLPTPDAPEADSASRPYAAAF